MVHFSAFSTPPNALPCQAKTPKTGDSGKSDFRDRPHTKESPANRPAIWHTGPGRGGWEPDRSTMSNIKAPQQAAARGNQYKNLFLDVKGGPPARPAQFTSTLGSSILTSTSSSPGA